MKIFGIELIHEFARQYADARASLRVWVNETKAADWSHPNDIKAQYATASFLSDNRVVFNIKGNRYRLLVEVTYRRGSVIVLRIGTHAEYDKWKL